ncbi:MAG: agmatine deiminase family protein [Prevotella sp.]|nr:agmatine deiminase family protein [Prevotella sp.]
MNNNEYMPAEWEQQSMVQLTWAHKETDWQPYLDDITSTMTEMAVAIAEHETLLVATRDADNTKNVLRKAMTDRQWERVRIVPCVNDDTWARDHAFITVADRERKVKKLLDFRFNGWGGKFHAENDNAINKSLYENHVVEGDYEDHNDFVLEGGSVESDGKGTVFTTTCCLLAPNRNQPMTKQQIDTELTKRLRAERIVWLDCKQLEGDDTDGHIDTLVRCAPDDTLLFVSEADRKELEGLRTLEGRPYRLLQLPQPKPVFFFDEQLPATYANFLVINGAVLVPTYDQPKLDMEACETIAEAFPDRDIIPIDSRIIIRQHGSIHCLTMQYY